MFHCVMKEIQPFAENFLSYILTKYYYNRSTSDLVIVKTKRVNFFETQCIIDPIDSFLDFIRESWHFMQGVNPHFPTNTACPCCCNRQNTVLHSKRTRYGEHNETDDANTKPMHEVCALMSDYFVICRQTQRRRRAESASLCPGADISFPDYLLGVRRQQKYTSELLMHLPVWIRRYKYQRRARRDVGNHRRE